MDKKVLLEAKNKLILDKKLDEKSQSSLECYSKDVDQFIKFLGSYDYKLNKEKCIEYKECMEEKYEYSTINRKITSVNMFLSILDPGLKIKQVKIQQHLNLEDVLTYKEYLRICKQAEKKRDYKILYIMKTLANTGMRISEALNLQYEDLIKKSVKIKLKSKVRNIPLKKQLVKDLKEYCRTQNITSGLVFLSNRGNKMNRSNVYCKIKEYTGLARVKKTKGKPHGFRHMFAKEFLATGGDITQLSNILGHSSLSTTMLYVTGSSSEHLKSMERMKY